MMRERKEGERKGGEGRRKRWGAEGEESEED